MPKRKSSRRKTGDTNDSVNTANEQVAKESSQAQQLLPEYQPLDFSATPKHMDVINKKIRNTKKKLRKMTEIEQALAQGKKITQEQQSSLAFKPTIERNLADFEEIKKSMENLDLSKQLRLLLGVFFAAAKTNSETLTFLSVNLLPPGDPPVGYHPLKELQHACEVAELFLSGKPEEAFQDPTVTFQQLQEEVKEFLIPKEDEEEENVIVEPQIEEKEEMEEIVEKEEVREPEQIPVQSVEEPNAVDEVETAVAESNDEPPTNTENEQEESKEVASPKNEQKKQDNKKRNNRRRGGKGDSEKGDRVYSPKSGRGRKTDHGGNRENKNERGEKSEWNDRRGRGRGTRGGRGRGNYRGKRGGDTTTKEVQSKSKQP